MRDGHELEAELREALAERDRLRNEVRRLKADLARQGVLRPESILESSAGFPLEVPQLSPDQKITLFRGLFRGREDVYAERWEGRNGQSGYMPASEKNW
jgi:hypothetical protein